MSVLGVDLPVDLLISTVTIETWNCHSWPLDVSRGIHLLADLGVDLANLISSWPLCHCVQHPWKLTSGYFWSSRNERQPLSKLKHVLRKYSGVSQKQWMLELSNLCHCIQLPWKLTSRDFWSSRNDKEATFSAKMWCILTTRSVLWGRSARNEG